MSNIAISQIDTAAQSINAGDLLLISKNNGDGTYTSAKLTASKLLACSRELDYDNVLCNNSLVNDLFKKNEVSLVDQNNMITTDSATSAGITLVDNEVKNLFLDVYTVPYSGLLVTNFQLRLKDNVQYQSDQHANMTLLNGTTLNVTTSRQSYGTCILHWHSTYLTANNSIGDMDCFSKSCFVSKGDKIKLTITRLTSEMAIRDLDRCCIVPYKYN